MREFSLVVVLAFGCGPSPQSRDHTSPTASFVAYPLTGDAPLQVTFDGTASYDNVGVADWRWDFGDGAAGTGKIAHHTFTSRGDYAVTLLVLDAAGNAGQAQKTVSVKALPDTVAPQAAVSAAPLSGLAPLAVHFDGAGSSDDRGITSWVWDFGDGASASTAAADHTYASAGAFTARLTVRDAAGNSASAGATIIVTAPVVDTAPPTALLRATPLAGLAPLAVHLDGSGSTDDVGVTSWHFDLGDGRTLDGSTQDATFAVAGRYPLTLTVHDAAGNSAVASAVLSVETLPIVPDEHAYDDAMDAPWADWSWSTNYDLAATPSHAGAHSIRFKPQSWEALRFHDASGFDTTGYDRISIWVNGGTAGGQKLLVAANAGGQSEVALETYLQNASVVPAGGWAQALIPLAALGLSGSTLPDIILKDGSGTSQPDVYVDDVTLYPELGGPAVAPCPAFPQPSAFVTRSGSALRLGGAAWRATGANVYYLQNDLANAQQFGNANLLKKARESLDVLVCLAMPVTRTWAFNEHPVAQDAASIQPSAGVYREEGLVALDQSIAEIKARGLRTVLTLVDNWSYYGGLDTYASWAGKTHDDFFTDATIKAYWKAYVSMLLARVNTVTGVRYRDEPAILAWELGNEFRCEACKNTTKLHDAIGELAAHLKGLGPSQLIADGGEGFDDHPQNWNLSNNYPVSGSEGASFSTLSLIPELDLLSYHVYPINWGLNADADATEWFAKHQSLAASGGKLAYPGEYGFQASDDAARAQKYDGWLGGLYGADGGSLGLLWQILPEGVPNNDGFGVFYPSDAATLAVLGKWARTAR